MQPISQVPSSDYFGGTGVPGWYEDETLYSLASRFHHLSGNPSAYITSVQLFGGANIGYQHDLPCGLNEFTRITEGSLGTAHNIIREHTILPYYLPFRTEHDANDAYSTMASPSIGSLKYRLGILTSRFRANHPLKACIKCMSEDQKNNFVAYWHLSHQYPGVWLCMKHDEFLSTSTVKSTGVGRFQWLLPRKDALIRATTNSILENSESTSLLRNLAEAATALALLPDNFHFDTKYLLGVYHTVLNQRGFITNGGSLRLNRIAESYLNEINLPLNIHELSALPTTISAAKQQIGQLLRTPRSGTHPLRHLMLILWLYQDWASFWKAYLTWQNDYFSADRNTKPDRQPTQSNNDDRKNALINLIQDKGFSITKAAKTIGIDTNTAITWAAQFGISAQHRPKILKKDLRKKLVQKLEKGNDKTILAKQYGISTQTVSRVLRTELGLQQAWLDARFKMRLDKERRIWRKLVATQGRSGIKALRMIAPATYMWLYRNDRAWLDIRNRKLPTLKNSNHSSVDWDSRDILLSTKLEQLALELSIQNANSSISLGKICQLLPELKPKIERLHRLPLTYLMLQNILGKKFRRSHTQELF